MKPNFALSLSHDGIALLQRSAAGWRVVGEADPSSPDLAEELEVLRRTAAALAPGGLRCKIIIPNDQIRFLSIETPEQDLEARKTAAETALDGATPYAVSDLVFDIQADGDTTHVAAVARDTLQEAESFATAHQFHAVSFAAQPEAGQAFAAEVFFGVTDAASELLDPGEAVERETGTFFLAPEPDAPEAAGNLESNDAPEAADADPGPSFVSRRRVPTFRTSAPTPRAMETSTANSAPGFAEPQTPFEGAAPRAQSPTQKPAVVPAPAPVVRRPESETERFTIYGAPATTGRSSRMGMTAVAGLVGVAFLAGIAAFASGATGTGLSGLLARLTTPEPVVQFAAPAEPQSAVTIATSPDAGNDPTPNVELASLSPSLTDEDAAVLDALRAPVDPEPDIAAQPSQDDLLAAYAVSGIWPVAPDVPNPPPLVDLDDLYVTSIDPINPNFDAVALPALTTEGHDLGLLAPVSPAPAGTVFTLDERGLVVATAEGSMNPDGVMVFAGAPPARQPTNMVKAADPEVDLTVRLRLAAFRPKPRPSDLIETAERAAFSGLTRSELSEIRPRLRPQSAQESALASASLVSLDGSTSRSLLENPGDDGFDNATARAVLASLRPDARPNGFERTVAKAMERAPKPTETARVAPRTVTPKIPSSASASREATVKNAINLRKVNLIGVYGKPSSRRALVRLGSGRYRKVEVGDRIDGGRVSAIGDSELRYQKNGRAVVLKMPRG
ncbi:MAG: hypothetical protein AAF999_02960 [Pseudomonadota bacterium]